MSTAAVHPELESQEFPREVTPLEVEKVPAPEVITPSTTGDLTTLAVIVGVPGAMLLSISTIWLAMAYANGAVGTFYLGILVTWGLYFGFMIGAWGYQAVASE